MIGFLYRLIIGSIHAHKWETMKDKKVDNSDWGGPVYTRIQLRCEHCGVWKKVDLK